MMKKARMMMHGVSVPDLRSDGESTSNDRTPPSASSSTRSSNPSSNLWTGSLPNLTLQLSSTEGKTSIDLSLKKKKKIIDPYTTFADNLHEKISDPSSSKVKTFNLVLHGRLC